MDWTLVTGGAKGLGREICLWLAQQGYDLVIHYRSSRSEALKVKEECQRYGVQAECMAGDFSSLASTEQFIREYLESFSQTRNLINNVGTYLICPLFEIAWEEWMSLFQTNLHVPFALTRGFLPSIQKLQGNIVNLGMTGLTSWRADTRTTAYTLAKAALWGLTRSLARELAPSQVTVNMVSPGYLENSVDLPSDLERIPMHRLGTGQEVARVVAFLLAPENHYITGQNIEVVGGVRL